MFNPKMSLFSTLKVVASDSNNLHGFLFEAGDQPVGYQCNIYSFLAFAGKVKKHTFSFFPGCCKSIIVSGREIFSVTVAYGITEFIIFA